MSMATGLVDFDPRRRAYPSLSQINTCVTPRDVAIAFDRPATLDDIPDSISEANACAITSAEILECLDRICRSQTFSNAGQMVRFLRYVVEGVLAGDADSLKESLIGVNLLNREPGYDPRTDGIVRTQARRFRERLERYYASEGAADAIIIDVPKGRYVPVFHRREVPATEPLAVEPARVSALNATPLPASQGRPGWVWGVSLALLAILLAIGFPVVWHHRPAAPPIVSSSALAARLPKVVVLEFLTTDTGSEADLYGRALADSLVTWLARINDVSVVTPIGDERAASQEPGRDIEIAKKMKADYIVSGRFEKQKGQSRIWVRLSETATGAVVWGQMYSFVWPSLVKVEDHMGSALMQNLSLRLGASHAAAVNNVPAKSVQAYETYLNGHYALKQGQRTFRFEAIHAAERYFQQALEMDPEFPDALAGLGEVHLLLAFPWRDESNSYLEKAETEARAAMVRAPRHAGAISLLARCLLIRGQRRTALEQARSAVEADPGSTVALNALAEVYAALGLEESAAAVYRECLEKHPIDIDPYVSGALLLARTGKFDEALASLKAIADIDADSPHIPYLTGEILTRKGDFAGAATRLRQVRDYLFARVAGDRKKEYQYSYLDNALALAEVRQGHPAFAQQVFRKFGDTSMRRVDTLILLTAAAGRPEASIENLKNSPYFRNYRYLVTERGLRPLYGRSGFKRLLEETYTEWTGLLAAEGNRFPAKPPVLPAPTEFLRSQAVALASNPLRDMFGSNRRLPCRDSLSPANGRCRGLHEGTHPLSLILTSSPELDFTHTHFSSLTGTRIRQGAEEAENS